MVEPQALRGSDAGFLFIETPEQTSTCVDLAVLAPPPAGTGPLTVDSLRRHIADRLHLIPAFRWRLAPVPGGIGHPVWVEDPDFDLDYHLRHAVVDAPGDDAALDRLMATMLPGLLDRRHPLWQVVLVDGLAGGRQALIFRFHHTLADGAGLIATIGRIFDADGPPPPPPASTATAPVGPTVPRPGRLFLTTLVAQIRAWLAAPRLLVDTLRRFKAVDRRRESADVPVPRSMVDAPHSALNRCTDARRVYARALLPLADLRQVRREAGTTLSDVVLAVVAGGLRSHLAERQDLPAEPMVVNVPVGNDDPDAPPRQTGNVFANYFAHLATDVADPRERLAATAAYNEEAKFQLEILGRDTLPAWLDRIPPFIAGPAARAIPRRRAAKGDPPDFNVLVSNVRADVSNWRLDDRAVEHYSMSGPVADGAGLNITVTGAGDTVTMSLVANPAAVERPDELARSLESALRELVDAHHRAVV